MASGVLLNISRSEIERARLESEFKGQMDRQIMEGKLDKARQEAMQKGRQEGMQKGRQEGMQKGRQEGMQKGRQEGMQKGREEGMQKGMEQTARNALAEGASIEFVQRITGFDLQTIRALQSQ